MGLFQLVTNVGVTLWNVYFKKLYDSILWGVGWEATFDPMDVDFTHKDEAGRTIQFGKHVVRVKSHTYLMVFW